uniref:Uncharacterized protein n=1 Tax=Vespula pensylvanica TaxID=30213 RepID=A0A834NDI2_VESPE|nr:hypothetical protein H0235_014783 [Vespula pensylvanica]
MTGAAKSDDYVEGRRGKGIRGRKKLEIPSGALGRFMPALAGWMAFQTSRFLVLARESYHVARGSPTGYYTICTES